MAALPTAYNLTRSAASGFSISPPNQDCGCDEVIVDPDDGGDPTDDSDGTRKDPDGITVESFCPDLILVELGAESVDFIDGNNITIGIETLECAEGIHEVTKTLIDLDQYFFEVVSITSDFTDPRALDWTICDGVCDIGVDYRQDIEFRFIEAFFFPHFGQTIQINVTIKSCKMLFVRTFDVAIPTWPIN